MDKKFIVILALLAGLGLAGWRLFGSDAGDQGDAAETAAAAKTAAVSRGGLRVTVETSGRVVPHQEVEIKCKASGEIVTLPVDVSDRVTKGDLLVQLDPVDEERSVKRSEVALAASEARLAQAELEQRIAARNLETERLRAQAASQLAAARLEEAGARRDRLEALLAKNMASQEECESARTSLISAQADVANARAREADLEAEALGLEKQKQSVNIARTQVEGDRLSLQDARQRLADTTVRAPLDGVITDCPVQVGQIIASGINNVGGGTLVLCLADLSRMYILATVDESDIGRIETGQRARITTDAYPDRRFFGEVVRVAARGVNTSGVVTFEVKVEVLQRRKGRGEESGEPEQEQLLRPEMTADLEITVVEREDVLLVPADAVSRRRGERIATVRDAAGRDEERTVTVGASDGEMIEILEGLAEGETVVRQGTGDSPWQGSSRDEWRQKRREERMKAGIMGGGGRPPH